MINFAHMKEQEAVPLVSVIVPNYNYARYLDERIQSILNQEFQDFEIILLDDASSDASPQVLERYANHPKVSAVELNERNSGSPFAQWEKGISLARGKYIWIAEADDSAEPDFLRFTVEALERNPKASVAMTMSRLVDSEGKPHSRAPFEKFKEDGKAALYDGNAYNSSRMQYHNYCYNASMVLFRKSKYEQLTRRVYRSMRYTGDWAFWVEMFHDAQLVEIHRKLNRFRLHGSSTTVKGTRNQEALPECLASSYLAFKLGNGKFRKGEAWVRQYRCLRDLRRSKNLDAQGRQVLERMKQVIGAKERNFPLLWIYKHCFNIRHSEKPLEPLDIFELT